MAKNDKLDTNSTKLLKKLGEQWEGKVGLLSDKLTVQDLRLLLENFLPLQELIRQIAAPAVPAAPTTQPDEIVLLTSIDAPADYAPHIQELEKTREALAEQQQQVAQLQAQLAQHDAEVAKLTEAHHQALAQQQQQLEQKELLIAQRNSDLETLAGQAEQAMRDLKKCNATVDKLQKDKESAKEDIKNLKNERKQLGQDLEQAQSELAVTQARTCPPPELALLRNDPQLAQDMGLTQLPEDDTQALIQVVAVLSQIESITRLWNTLKDRCEDNNRSASNGERALLQAALGWHNHNWHTTPYRLLDVSDGSRYDYEAQLRSRNTPKGETVAALLLPGIAPHVGEALCKPLVRMC